MYSSQEKHTDHPHHSYSWHHHNQSHQYPDEIRHKHCLSYNNNNIVNIINNSVSSKKNSITFFLKCVVTCLSQKKQFFTLELCVQMQYNISWRKQDFCLKLYLRTRYLLGFAQLLPIRYYLLSAKSVFKEYLMNF